MIERLPTTQDWMIECWTCHNKFLVDSALMRADMLIVCPACGGWSGFKWKNQPIASVSIANDPGQGRSVGELWAWITVDPRTGLESMCGVMLSDGTVSAVGPTLEAAERLRPFIEEARRISNKRFRLVRFGKVEVIAEL